MVKKGRVHGFADQVVASKGKGQVADTPANVYLWQVFAYPGAGFDKIKGIPVVCVDARGYGQYIGVNDNILWGKAA